MPIMAKSLLTLILHLSAFIFQATAFPRQNQALPVMPCGNALSKSNQNLCMTFNGGGVCTWDRTSMPHCRIGKDFGAAARLLGEALDKVSIPAKPYNAYTVIHAAKMFGTQHGNVQIKMRAEEHERRLRFGRTPFDQSRSPQCLLNVPMCRRVACGGFGSQNNATQCLFNPECCFDLSLYQYQFTYGSEFMGGAPACYHGPSSASFKNVIGLVRPWSAWYPGVVLDLFHEELMRPASLNYMQGCSAIASDRKTCGWHDITESECRLKDCCYTRHGTCVYPHSHVFNGLKTAGSYPDLYSTVPKHGQCTANPFQTHPSYDRLSCHRLTSDPYSVLSCPSECCLDKSAIEATLSTHGFISYSHQSQAVRGHQSNYHTATHSNPNYYTPPKAQPAFNPMSGLSPITPDLVNMMSAIASTNQESVESSDVNQLMQQIMGNGQNIPSMHMPTLGKNPFMQMVPPAGNNPFGQMPAYGNNPFPQIPQIPGNPSGLDGGILQLFLNNGGSTPSSYGGGRSLNPDVNSMMDAYMVGLFNQGKSNTGLPQGMNPNMLYYLMQSKENGKGMDMSKLMQLGMMPYGLSQKGGQGVNPLLLTMLLGNKTGDNDMSDMMKYAMLQGNGNGGNSMATNMLLMNLMNKKGGSKDSSNNLMLMSMLSNMQRNRGQQHNGHAHKPPTNDGYNYQRYPPHETYRNHHRQDTQYTKTHGPSSTYTRPSPTQYQQKHPNNDRAFVNDLLSRRVATNPIPYCPYTFTRIGNFPDLTHAVRGCCKAIACYHKKEVKRSDPTPLPKPTYSQWSAWTPCDRTCGVAAFRTRVRSCIRHNQLSISCEGPSRQLEKCKLGPCHLSVIGQAQSGGMTEPDNMRRGLSMPSSEKPETKEELNALMETLLRELDNPSALPKAPIPPFPNNVPPTPSPINPFHTAPMKPFPMNTGTLSHSKQPPHMTRGQMGGGTPQKEHQYAPWSTWSICDRKCGGGNMIRMRLCMSANGGCQGKSEEINVCNTEACQAPSPISMATVSTPMNKPSPNPLQGLVPLPFDNQLETLPPVSPSQQSLIANKVDTPSNNFVYGAWSEWTQCRSGASNCTGDGTTTRQRSCFIYLDDNTPVRQTNCKDSVQINPCKVVCESISTSDELETDVPDLPENETMQSVDESTDNVIEDLNDDGSWSRWSECKGPCGLDKGISTRQRKCLTTVDDPFCDEVGFILKSQRTCTLSC